MRTHFLPYFLTKKNITGFLTTNKEHKSLKKYIFGKI
jgi:hypothetical protein